MRVSLAALLEPNGRCHCPHLPGRAAENRRYCARGERALPPPEQEEAYLETEPEGFIRPVGGFWALGGRLTWVAAIVLTVSAFTDWYAESGLAGPTIAVIGWHTGTLGKLVFFIGLVLLLLAILREFGFELPPAIPESLVVIALGSLATIFVLIRLISIPDSIPPPAGRGHRDLDQPGRRRSA